MHRTSTVNIEIRDAGQRLVKVAGLPKVGDIVPTINLSDFIRANIEAIIKTWEEFARPLLAVRQADLATARDHAEGILRTIAADLDRPESSHQQAEKSKGRAPQSATDSQAELHGAARMAAGFSVVDEMSEFRALRASVLRLWLHDRIAPENASDQIIRFNEAIDQALGESVARYSADKERSVRLFNTLLSTSPDLSYILDVEGRLVYANTAMTTLYGISISEIVGKHFSDLDSSAASEIRPQLDRVMDTKTTHRGEMRCTPPTGNELIFEYTLVPVMTDEGTIEGIAGMARDITERKTSEESATQRSNYDLLTGLPNRSLFLDRLDWEVRRSERTDLPLAVFFVDLDGFKEVNDQMGHDAGDQLLREVAQRLSSCVRASDTVARLGGDEFTVIISDVRFPHVEIVAGEILAELARPFSLRLKEANISASIGITLFPQDATTAEDLMKNADQAMYGAKTAGRNCFNFFTPAMRDAAWAHRKLMDELRLALPQQQLAVYFQPIVELSNERIAKAEALLRWNHPQGGLMQSGEFIGLAEAMGLIDEIDDWVLGEAMKCSHDWSGLLGVPFQIGVNKSLVEFMNKAPVKNWDTHLAALGLSWNSISMDITEGVLLNDSPRVAEKLVMLQKAGVQLAIEGFGSGYSSMSHLKKFNVSYLKIDQSFVQHMTANLDSRIFAEAIIVMAHKLGLKVIAEGVETLEQKNWLKTAECDYAQGYLFSAPLPSGDFEKLLSRDRAQYH